MDVGGGGRRERRWRAAMAGSGGLVLATGIWAVGQTRDGLDAVDVASVAGLVVAVASLGVAVVGLRATYATLAQSADAAQAVAAAADLARQVERAETEQWRRLIGGDRHRINLRYCLHPQYIPGAQTPGPQGRLFDDGHAVSVPHIGAYYRATRPRRLVVTGAAGAGKTVLALELLLDLIEHREENDPVPVRVSLADWDTSTPFEGFLTDHLAHALDWPKARAVQLVAHGMVLPVLEGLDEMDPGLVDANGRTVPDPQAQRARAALEALNGYGTGRTAGAVVLTCRASHYTALADDDQLADAARIRIDDVPVADAIAYLTVRSGHATRWQPVLDHLAAEPSGVLAHHLSTPWRLSLAATVYRRTGDPAELLGFPIAASLDEHLIARLIPATVDLHPPTRRRWRKPEDVQTWLALIARHLQSPAAGAETGAARTDIRLHELWPLSGVRRVPISEAILSGLIIFCAGLAAWVLLAWAFHTAFDPFLLTMVQLCAWTAAAPALLGDFPPTRLTWRHFTTPTGRQLKKGCWFALLFGPPVGLTVGIEAGPTPGAITGLATGAALGSVMGVFGSMTSAPGPIPRPGDVLRGNVLHGTVCALVGGPAFGSVFGLMSGLSEGAAAGLVEGGTLALIIGLAIGLTVAAAARRYLVFLLYARRILPFRLNKFLTWAYEANLLRFSGNAYQFRHRELQHWLTTHPAP
ncbi:hypothetical protein [Streptomyces bobili]|uniref:hypothetical protein n=1 Tax=Streptomyces bobili TaxID=67280 RepID=UPI0037A08237